MVNFREKGIDSQMNQFPGFSAWEERTLWQASEWRKDSRIELIFPQPHANEKLEHLFSQCLVDN